MPAPPERLVVSKGESHASRQELLLFADGELPLRRANRVRAHLAVCWECRTRMAQIERSIADFARLHRQALEAQLPPIARPRALLRAKLAELAGQSSTGLWRRLCPESSSSDFALGFILMLVLAMGSGLLYHSIPNGVSTGAGSLPNPTLTPGFTRSVALTDLCVRDHDEVVRNVPSPLRERVFREYGISGVPDADYEVDYLITPGLGGADDIRNLWPEPHHDTPWNSYVKDQLEDRLHQMVCSGEISLTTAQKDIAHDWIAAYRKYFHTDGPIPNNPTPSATHAFRYSIFPMDWFSRREIRSNELVWRKCLGQPGSGPWSRKGFEQRKTQGKLTGHTEPA